MALANDTDMSEAEPQTEAIFEYMKKEVILVKAEYKAARKWIEEAAYRGPKLTTVKAYHDVSKINRELLKHTLLTCGQREYQSVNMFPALYRRARASLEERSAQLLKIVVSVSGLELEWDDFLATGVSSKWEIFGEKIDNPIFNEEHNAVNDFLKMMESTGFVTRTALTEMWENDSRVLQALISWTFDEDKPNSAHNTNESRALAELLFEMKAEHRGRICRWLMNTYRASGAPVPECEALQRYSDALATHYFSVNKMKHVQTHAPAFDRFLRETILFSDQDRSQLTNHV
jgi:hypothetical protein